MKRMGRIVIALAALTIAGIAGAGEEIEAAAETRILVGEFAWNRGAQGDLEAIFTSTGEDEWIVDFHFTFRDTPRTFSGTAKGSLSEGALAGTVKNQKGNRTWTFEGTFEDGTLSGTHAETSSGEALDTGTLTLMAKAAGSSEPRH